MTKMLGAVALAAFAAVALPNLAHAKAVDTFELSSLTFSDTGNQNPTSGCFFGIAGNCVSFSGSFANSSPTFTGGVGDYYTDLLSVTGTDLNLLTKTQTDSVAVTATFTLPGSATGVIGGTGSLTDTLHFAWEGTYWTDTGTITWDPATNPTEITFANGSALQLAMDNIQLQGSAGTATGSGNLTMTVEKVPEPTTLALLGVGLLGLGMVARRRPAGSIPA